MLYSVSVPSQYPNLRIWTIRNRRCAATAAYGKLGTSNRVNTPSDGRSRRKLPKRLADISKAPTPTAAQAATQRASRPGVAPGRVSLLTVEEWCAEAGVSRDAFDAMRRRKQAPVCTVLKNGKLRIHPRDADDYLAECREDGAA